MESNSISQKIKRMIKRSQSAEHYTKDELRVLNYHSDIADNLLKESKAIEKDEQRINATLAQIALDRYFKQHPEDSIENYLD